MTIKLDVVVTVIYDRILNNEKFNLAEAIGLLLLFLLLLLVVID